MRASVLLPIACAGALVGCGSSDAIEIVQDDRAVKLKVGSCQLPRRDWLPGCTKQRYPQVALRDVVRDTRAAFAIRFPDASRVERQFVWKAKRPGRARIDPRDNYELQCIDTACKSSFSIPDERLRAIPKSAHTLRVVVFSSKTGVVGFDLKLGP